MADKKYYILRGCTIAIALGLILVTLLVPMVKIAAYDQTKTLVYDNTVSLLQYSRDLPFWKTDAFDVYFNATGPMWIAVAGILMNYLLLPFSLVIIVLNIVELAFAKKNLAIKNNALLRKLILFLGYFVISIFVLEFVAFLLTTIMANGYALFASSYQNYIALALGIGLLVCGYCLDKKDTEQEPNKIKNCLGFGLCTLTAILGVALLFMPQYSEILTSNKTSFYYITTIVADLGIAMAGGDYPIGLTRFAIWALILIGLFVFIYSVIGFVMTLKNKPTNWLSAHIKRWSFAFLITYAVLYFFVISGMSVLMSGIYIDEYSFITPLAYFAVFVPFLPYAFACFVSYNKNLLRRTIRKNKKKQECEAE